MLRTGSSGSRAAPPGTRCSTPLFPGQYGFAALRCAIDNYNADNVEWVSYPTTYHHVFCYEYVVTPPPHPATIVVRKQLQGGTDGPGTFRYVGNISYTAANDFFLTADVGTTSSMSFVRAADLPWDFTEQPIVRAGPWSEPPAHQPRPQSSPARKSW